MADITTGLVNRYALDEGTGTTADDSGSAGKDGTLTAGPTWVAGHIGAGAVQFDGTDDRIVLGAVNETLVPDCSAFMWIKTTDGSASLLGCANGIFTAGYRLGIGNVGGAGRLSLERASGSGVASTATVNGDEWTHVGFTWTAAGVAKLYVNGSEDGSASVAAPTAPDRISAIGAKSSGVSGDFAGQIDEVRLYNRVLAPEDVAELYAFTGGGGGSSALLMQMLMHSQF